MYNQAKEPQKHISNTDKTLELITMLNAKEITSQRITALKNVALKIDNDELKKILLLDKLYSDNYISKILAIESLGPGLVYDNEIRTILLDLLKENNHDKFKKAIINAILPSINKYKEIEDSIAGILHDPRASVNVKEKVIRILAAKIQRPEYRKAIVSKINDMNVEIRIAAIEALADCIDNEEILNLLLEKLNDLDKPVKVTIIQTITPKAGRNDIQKILISKLKNPNENKTIRQAIIDALSLHIQDSTTIQEVFVDLFFNDEDCLIRNSVKRVLLSKLTSEALQRIFTIKVISEKSMLTYKTSIHNKMDRLGSDFD